MALFNDPPTEFPGGNHTMTGKRSTLIGMMLVAGLTSIVETQNRAADWPQWRGANRDGAAASFAEPSAWPAKLNRKWKVEVGLGYASPLVIGNRVFMFSRQGDNEVMMALDTDSGKVLWRSG